MPVKTETRPPDLRAFCARNAISYAEIGRKLGCGRRYVSEVLRADRNGKSVSPEQLDRIRQAALSILWERDAA